MHHMPVYSVLYSSVRIYLKFTKCCLTLISIAGSKTKLIVTQAYEHSTVPITTYKIRMCVDSLYNYTYVAIYVAIAFV